MSSDNIFKIFPSSFYISENLLNEKMVLKLQKKSKQIQKKYQKGGSDWRCNTYNTLGTYELNKDKDFKILLNEIEKKTLKFTQELGSNYVYETKESWLNIYKNKDYQEFHFHDNSTFSAVYFLKSSKQCAKLIFENPIEPDKGLACFNPSLASLTN